METPKGLAAMRNRMMERKPEADWENTDDDAMADMAMADYDEMSTMVDDYKKRDAVFDELAVNHPEGMMFLTQLAKGKDLREALENATGVSFEELYNDPDYPAAKADRETKQTEAVRGMLKNLEAEAEKNGWSEEELDEALGAIDEFIQAVEGNTITLELLDLLRKGKKYDADVANAKHEGEVSGRNAKIEETHRKRKASSDGLPVLGGKTTGGDKTIVRNAKTGLGSGIWDAANMKRNNYQ